MKKHILVAFILIFFSSIVYAQNTKSSINVGDVFTINEVASNDYKHINFPNSNLIIKKGGIASYQHITGEKVEITSMKEKKDGSRVATIKLTSKKLFFNSHKYITVAIDKAIDQKELVKL
jgi:hypothetical protein